MKSCSFPCCAGFICLVLFCQQLYWSIILHSIIYQRIEIQGSRFDNIRKAGIKNSVDTHDLVLADLHSKDLKTERNNSTFLIYQFPTHTGQGLGNIISGVLAAHRLAEEFQRTICHMGHYSVFDQAFQWKDMNHIQKCEEMLLHKPNASNTIVQNNFDETSVHSECAMRVKLSNYEQYPVMYYKGNTYPRWPTTAIASPENDNNKQHLQIKKLHKQLPRDYFHEKFQPTIHLIDILPWNIDDPPSIVVHLREGDGKFDERAGLDNHTLSLLADDLNNIVSTVVTDASHNENKNVRSNDRIFLVSNRVEWYDKFPNWAHPSWSLVKHSAFKKGKEKELLQMWADWYTLLNAKQIYHTLSDFSRSAARWNENIQSWTIVGSTTSIESATGQNNRTKIAGKSELILRSDLLGSNESYTPRLVDRKKEDLKFCDPEVGKKYLIEKKNKEFLDLMNALKRHRGG